MGQELTTMARNWNRKVDTQGQIHLGNAIIAVPITFAGLDAAITPIYGKPGYVYIPHWDLGSPIVRESVHDGVTWYWADFGPMTTTTKDEA